MTTSVAPRDRGQALPGTSQHPTPGRVQRGLSYGVDALALLALAAVLLYLAGRDGGFGMSSWHLGGVAALALLPTAREVWRVPTIVQAVVAAWAATAVIALLFAVDRSGFVEVTLVYALMPMTALSTMGLLRRPWGRAVVVALLVLSFTLYWHRSFMQWWGYTIGDLETRWLPLSWHNQAATLMAAFGVFFFALAATTRRVVAIGAGMVAAMGLAGTWLAGSRGALVAAVLGLLVAAWLGGRWQGWRRAAAVTCAVGLVTVGIIAGLMVMDDTAERVTSEQSAGHNLEARLYHMEAASGMFLERPLTGYGPGSYGISARAHTRPEANLTIAPHNEFLEAFAEGGLPLGLAVLAGGLLAAWGSWRVIAGRPPPHLGSMGARARLETATTAGGAAATVVLLSHAVVDFDWRYPVLGALLAIMAALAWTPHDPDREQASDQFGRPQHRQVLAIAGLVSVSALLAAGLTGAWTQRASVQTAELSAEEFAVAHPVWDGDANAQAAVALLRGGDVRAAARAVQRTQPWNPGWSELEGLAAIIQVQRGTLAPRALVDAFPPHPTRLTLRNLASELLLRRGEHAVAEELLNQSLTRHREFRGWGVASAVARTWELRIQLAASTDGCAQAGELAATAGDEPLLSYDENAPSHFRAYADAVCDERGA